MPDIITTPIIGASLTNVWKPPVGVTPGADGDKYAPFALGTPGQGIVGANGATPLAVQAQFCRVGAAIGATGSSAIVNGVATGATGVWDNKTGVALVEGDYVFLAATGTVEAFEVLAADKDADKGGTVRGTTKTMHGAAK